MTDRARSPNFTERRGGAVPALIVLHYTGMESAAAACARLCDPAAEVSAHYLVAPDGEMIELVDPLMRAWHAGVSAWGGIGDVNSWSIGIELANPGPLEGFPPYPEAQMRATEALLGGLRARFAIPPERVVGHACIAPGRKIDPGRKLDWRRLALAGHGVWQPPPLVPGGPADPDRFRAAARAFGYPVDAASGWTAEMEAVWEAFALRFLAPTPLFGLPPCGAGVAHLEALAARWPVAPFVLDGRGPGA